MERDHDLRRLVRGMYALAVILGVFPLIELFKTVWPFSFGEMLWRYSAFGIAANYLYRGIPGLALAVALAYWLGDRRVLRWAGALAFFIVALCLPVMAVFALDIPAVAEIRGQEEWANTVVAGVIQELKYVGALVALALLGFGARGVARGGQLPRRPERALGSPSALRSPSDG